MCTSFSNRPQIQVCVIGYESEPKQHSQMSPSWAQLGPNWGPYEMLLGYTCPLLYLKY